MSRYRFKGGLWVEGFKAYVHFLVFKIWGNKLPVFSSAKLLISSGIKKAPIAPLSPCFRRNPIGVRPILFWSPAFAQFSKVINSHPWNLTFWQQIVVCN